MRRWAGWFLVLAQLFVLTPAHAVFLDCVFFDGFEDRGTTDPEALDALDLHNCARKTVDPAASPALPQMTWSASIADVAQSYANQCHYQHSGNASYGENIYAYASSGSGTATLSDAVTAWLSEEANYDYASNTCSGTTCGHYTQIVWRDSTMVGCGKTACSANSPFGAAYPNWTLVVCNYSPPGNYAGERQY